MEERQLEVKADTLVTTATAFTIQSHEDYFNAGAQVTGLRALKKEIVAFFKPMKQSADKAKKEILNREKAQLAFIKQAEKIFEDKMDYYDKAIEELRDAEAIDEPDREHLTERPKAVGVSKRQIPYYEIIELRHVNPEFKMIDDRKVKAVVKSMGKDAEGIVGGIHVKFKSSFTVRS